jgi:hypothetical protein
MNMMIGGPFSNKNIMETMVVDGKMTQPIDNVA